MKHLAWIYAVAASAGTLTLCSVGVAARQTTGPRNPALVIPSIAGQDLFTFYCATCHGHDGKGNGPIAAVLKVAPADLTQLRRRNGGTFPRERLVGFIAGGGPTLNGVHGSTEMPVWGPIFMELEPSDRMTVIRIENVMQYLETIQVK